MHAAYKAGLRSVAIAFMHGYRYAAHEKAARRIAEDIGFPQISASHYVSPLMKFVSRGDTTVVDAYLSPILPRYIEQVAAEMPGVRLLFMQSSGGLTDIHPFQGKDAILSGPAGGIVGMTRTAQFAGFDRVIGFDMGGTSTDISHYAGDFERAFETQVARCSVPACAGISKLHIAKEVLWDKFYTAAPRPCTRSEQRYSDRRLRSRR